VYGEVSHQQVAHVAEMPPPSSSMGASSWVALMPQPGSSWSRLSSPWDHRLPPWPWPSLWSLHHSTIRRAPTHNAGGRSTCLAMTSYMGTNIKQCSCLKWSSGGRKDALSLYDWCKGDVNHNHNGLNVYGPSSLY
jgi:hypothetical protein